MTNLDSTQFNRLFCELSEKDKEIFKNVTIKMLKVNFLLRTTNGDMYKFILNHKELMELFFKYLNFDFNLREDKDLAYIKTRDETVVNRIYKNETLCLLILRILYQEKLDQVTLADEIEVTVQELQDKLFAVGFEGQYNERVKKSTLTEMLKIFKAHNIVYYKDDLALDKTTITIYPSIEVAMNFREMAEVVNRLEMLKAGENTDDQIE